MSLDASAGQLIRQGLDLVLDWADYSSLRLHNWRDGREGVKGELTVTQNGVRYSWGAWSLASTAARDGLAKRLSLHQPDVPWGAHLEEAAWRFTQAARVGEPLTPMTGTIQTTEDVLMPGWLYAGEPTVLYADGDTGKSLTALAVALALQTGTALPGLQPTRAVQTAYLDWETSLTTMNTRLGLLAAGLGLAPPAVLYKRMTRPLVDEIGTLAADMARQHVGFVVIDSKMFAVSGGEGAAFHEPITAFYGALRLLAPAAVLVVNHITNADARTGAPARPFGGAFAFNGPRVSWEAKRDWAIEDATAIVFTAKKSNNLARKPDSFGLVFRGSDNPNDSHIKIEPLSLSTVAPQVLAGAKLTQRLTVMVSSPLSLEEILEGLPGANPRSVLRILFRLQAKSVVTHLPDGRWVACQPADSDKSDDMSSQSVTGQSFTPTDGDTPQSHPRVMTTSLNIGVVTLSSNAVLESEEPTWIHEDP